MLKMWLVFYLGNWLPLAGMLVWWRSMWTFLFLGSTVRLKAMLQGPVNQHWGSCKGRGWGTEYHGFLMVEGQLEKKECPCCTVPPECPLCNRTLTVLNSLVACKISWMSRWVPMHCIFLVWAEAKGAQKGQLGMRYAFAVCFAQFLSIVTRPSGATPKFLDSRYQFQRSMNDIISHVYGSLWWLFQQELHLVNYLRANWELFESYLKVIGDFFESCFQCSSKLPVFWEPLESYVWKVYLRYWMQLGQYGIDLLGLL